MRIDAPRGNESSLSGSFTGSFSGIFDGELSGLSGSIQEIYDTIASGSASFDQRILDVSASISGTINTLSGSITNTITAVSESINNQILYTSTSFSNTLVNVSESFSQSLNNVSESITRTIDTVKRTYVDTGSFNRYTASVDSTYYKKGSDALLSELEVVGDTLFNGKENFFRRNVTILGNLTVEGSSSVIHSEDVSIKDKFVEIASGASTVGEVDGAGFGIAGANVTMSYEVKDPADPTIGLMTLNKPFRAEGFYGDLAGNVFGNVTGSLYGTASNAVSSSYAYSSYQARSSSYAISSSQAEKATYAGEIDDDGLIARAIKRLENVARIKVENADRGRVEDPVFYISCGAHKDYQECEIRTDIFLDVPGKIIPGVEHYLLIKNMSLGPQTVFGSKQVPLHNGKVELSSEESLCLSYFTPTTESVLITTIQIL